MGVSAYQDAKLPRTFPREFRLFLRMDLIGGYLLEDGTVRAFMDMGSVVE